ncbi:HNH endonuclease [Aliivibrio sifiae]|uniref:HNH endonuclease n=1 Tax=Aliivibrio sifiae TaxID=566293 RepID=UPI003D10AEB0
MPEVFIKKLQSQESGYSGDKPNQRGKYILIPKGALSLFPVLSKEILNDTKIIKSTFLNGHSVGLNLVYNNAKYFPCMKRKHNEVRLYRNVFLDGDLNLDRNIIFIAVKLDDGEYAFDSILPNDSEYDLFDKLSSECMEKGLLHSSEITETSRINSLFTIKSEADILNNDDIIKATNKIFNKTEKEYKKARVQQPAMVGDKAAIFSSLIKSQNDFAKYLRLIYDNKCAIRGTSLITDNHAGLDAAHIQADTHGGPLLPSNGLLLSSDLHKCFDQGYLGLSNDNRVVIRSDVPKTSELYKYEGVVIKPIEGYEMCAPFHAYSEFHRNEHSI